VSDPLTDTTRRLARTGEQQAQLGREAALEFEVAELVTASVQTASVPPQEDQPGTS
jgi:hypothetical protein